MKPAVHQKIKRNIEMTKQVFEDLKQKAEQGDVDAQFTLGDIYCDYRTEGTPDYNKAIHWFTEAANQGHTTAQERLGGLYYEFGDYELAKGYSELSAKFGNNVNAQWRLGLIYAEGQGVEQDLKQAKYWFEKAAEQGNANAQHYLGLMYMEEEQYLEQAIYWFEKAAEQGLVISEEYLKMLYIPTKKKKYLEKARRLFEKQAMQGDTETQQAANAMLNALPKILTE